MTSIDSVLRQAFAPSGVLRASINFGNPVLASKGAGGEPKGISVDIATELARRLALPLQLVGYEGAGKAVAGIETGEVDVGFFAIDPIRGKEVAFTAPYVLILGSYLVRTESSIHTIADVDRSSVRVAVGKGSAYDLYLTRELKHAEIVRNSTSPEVVNTFLRDGLEVAAGVSQQLEADAKRLGGLRLLPGNFMVIRQAMGMAKSRGAGPAAWLDVFISELIRTGFIHDSITRNNIDAVTVAEA